MRPEFKRRLIDLLTSLVEEEVQAEIEVVRAKEREAAAKIVESAGDCLPVEMLVVDEERRQRMGPMVLTRDVASAIRYRRTNP